MSPTLQRVISQLQQLTLEEQWKLLGYLMKRILAPRRVGIVKNLKQRR